MAKFKALITGRYSPEVEAISEDAPSEVEIRFLPPGRGLATTFPMSILSMDISAKQISPKPSHCVGCRSLPLVLKG